MSDTASTADPGGLEGRDDSASAGNGSQSNESNTETSAAEGAYWRENIRLLILLMSIWFAVSYGAGIIFRDALDQFSLGGYPLGFWFAQQGSIYVFIALIVFYVIRMKTIERKYDLDD
jgi:putative solute:sodium symporter small subunit